MSDKEHDSHGGDSHGGGGGHGGGGHGGHGGGGGHEEGHEGAPEWLISFADNVALMMGFFVILLAMEMSKPKGSSASAGEASPSESSSEASPQMLDLAIAIREGFHNPVSIDSTNPDEYALVQRLRERSAKDDARDRSAQGRNDQVQNIRPTLYHGAGGVAYFARGTPNLDEKALSTIAQVAELVRGQKSMIEIRGHASAAEAFGRDDRGLELSYRRALSVAEALARVGVTWDRMRIVASGDNQRAVTPEHDETASRENQRVEIVALADRAGGETQSERANDEKPMPAKAPRGGAEDVTPSHHP